MGLCLLLLLSGRAVPAQDGRDAPTKVVPGARYKAGAIHRFLLGDTYRKLWTTPIRVRTLDLDEFAGGLTAFDRGGSKQSISLRFRAGDGRVFNFKLLEKDPTQSWPEVLRRGPPRRLADDQISAIFPAGALVISRLEEAAGLLHTPDQLVIVPDHRRLGEWREEFGGKVGLLEERVRGSGPNVRSVPGAIEVVDSDTLFARIRGNSINQVDRPEFLTARLFDLFVGDWDRHGGQWTWARFDKKGVRYWVPMPQDRDWALSRMDGLLYAVARFYMPQYQSFGADYGNLFGMTFNAQPLDRRLLSWLDRPTWDSVVKFLQGRLTDRAIARAVRALPPEFGPKAFDRLETDLRRRRDNLPEMADRFYRQLSSKIELWGSDQPDRVTMTRDSDGGLTVGIRGRSGGLHQRRFDPDETDEIRLRLFEGPDTVTVGGRGPAGLGVRVVMAGGPNLLVDSTGAGGIRVYDDSASTTIRANGPISRTTRGFASPVPEASPNRIHRDWGGLPGFTPWLEVGPEIGLLVGGGPNFTRYGFRKNPYQSRYAVRVGYATGTGGLNVDLLADYRFERPDLRFGFRLAWIDTDVHRFTGFGNESRETEPSEFYRVAARSYLFEPTLEKRLGHYLGVALGGSLKHSSTDLSEPSLIAEERPYGSGEFTAVGLRLSAAFDSRNIPAYATSGVRIVGRVGYFPAVFDLREAFQTAAIDASTYLTAKSFPTSPTLAVRVGGAKAWGRVPFFELPAIGGRSSLRGFSTRRFLGDGSVFGGAELRLDLGAFTLVAPGRWGIYGLGDIGRVYLDGENSNTWHNAAGGGLWFSFVDHRSTMSLTYAASKERGRFYFRAGMHF